MAATLTEVALPLNACPDDVGEQGGLHYHPRTLASFRGAQHQWSVRPVSQRSSWLHVVDLNTDQDEIRAVPLLEEREARRFTNATLTQILDEQTTVCRRYPREGIVAAACGLTPSGQALPSLLLEPGWFPEHA
jgi:hypothetical protein